MNRISQGPTVVRDQAGAKALFFRPGLHPEPQSHFTPTKLPLQALRLAGDLPVPFEAHTAAVGGRHRMHCLQGAGETGPNPKTGQKLGFSALRPVWCHAAHVHAQAGMQLQAAFPSEPALCTALSSWSSFDDVQTPNCFPSCLPHVRARRVCFPSGGVLNC